MIFARGNHGLKKTGFVGIKLSNNKNLMFTYSLIVSENKDGSNSFKIFGRNHEREEARKTVLKKSEHFDYVDKKSLKLKK